MALGSRWNWQLDDWPNFRYDTAKLEPLEVEFLRESGIFIGSFRHVAEAEKEQFIVDVICDEAFNTSEIENQPLNRDSLQSSIRRNLGFPTDNRKIPPAEQGISEMMADLHRDFAAPLTHKSMFRWHEMLMNGRRDLKSIGRYRGEESMQVVSGSFHEPRIHFEAPPSHMLRKEMSQFIKWFNDTGSSGKTPLPTLTRASLAHWYFVSIHPFEDGNGRIARALSEKIIAQGIGRPALIALSHTINSKRELYYDSLEYGNTTNEISRWMVYFASTIIEAQKFAQKMVDFLIEKAKFFDRLKGRISERQERVLLRMFREGPSGFKGGLSAGNYASIAGASRATVTRDLQDLVDKNALLRTGELKSTRYYLNINA